MNPEALRKGDTVLLTISDMAFGGAGVAKIQMGGGAESDPSGTRDFVVFIEGVAPGDRVEARLTRIKKNFAEARLERVVEPSAARIPPRCKHFGVCGGCTFQFLPYEEQLTLKEKMVRDALERIGGFSGAPIREIRPSPSPWFYRNKMEFTFSAPRETFPEDAAAHETARRAQKVAASPFLGLHKRGRFDEVFDLKECYLQSKFSVEIIQWMKDWTAREKLQPFNMRTNEGFLKTLIIREARNSGEWMINLVTTDSAKFPEAKFATAIMKEFPKITSLFHTVSHIHKGQRTRTTETLLAGKPHLTEIMHVSGPFRDHKETLSLIFDIAPSAFFQTNTKAAEYLLTVLMALGKPHSDDTVLDLYCGTGIMGMFFAKLARQVYGIELNESAVESARRNALKNNLGNIQFLCGDAAAGLKHITEKPSMVIVDPPRAGLMPETLKAVLDLAPKTLLYVSCNPTTLARDLSLLCAEDYRLKITQPMDMFPQTYHVETICLLEKKC